MQMIINLLINSSSTELGGRMSYFQVILKLLDIADREPELIEFYLPQLLQVSSSMTDTRQFYIVCNYTSSWSPPRHPFKPMMICYV
jgi:hypothetical protein